MKRSLQRSTERYESSTSYLAGASSTLSKRTSFPGDEPPLIARARGPLPDWDVIVKPEPEIELDQRISR